MTIEILTIECAGVAGISARNGAAGQAFTKVTVEKPDMFNLMVDWLSKGSVEDVLELIPNHDIELYMKDFDENKDGVTVTVKGVDNVFKGDELTSPAQQALLFISQVANNEELF